MSYPSISCQERRDSNYDSGFLKTNKIFLTNNLFYGFWLGKKRNLLKRKSWINIGRCAHLAFHLSTQTRGKTTQSVNYTTVTHIIKNTFIFRKNDFIRSLEKDWYQYRSDTIWWENICYFQDNWKWSTGKHTEKTEICCKIVKLARPFGKKKSQCFGIHCSEYISVQNFALGMKSLPSERLIDELHEPFEHPILHVIRNTSANKNHSTVYIWCYAGETEF